MSECEYIKKMRNKVVNGDNITNEEIMRGILMILTKYTEGASMNTPVDINEIAKSFYEIYKYESIYDVEKAADRLRKELSYNQYLQVISVINNYPDYRSIDMVDIMKKVL